jgi:hypothetical protein
MTLAQKQTCRPVGIEDPEINKCSDSNLNFNKAPKKKYIQ